MAAVTGPISTLPGAHHVVPDSIACDTHPDRVATQRVQGETDSFGCEMHDMCEECYAEHKKEMAETAAERATGTCEWCTNHATDLRNARDYEEGSYGRLYRVCGACIKKRNDEAEAELEATGFYDYDPVETGQGDWDPLDDHEPDSFLQDQDSVEGSIMTANDDGLPAYAGAVAYVDGQYYYGTQHGYGSAHVG